MAGIVLKVTFEASYQGDDFVPDDCTAKETVVVTMPRLDTKYVVFPKILEGATSAVIYAHRKKVMDYFIKKKEQDQFSVFDLSDKESEE